MFQLINRIQNLWWYVMVTTFSYHHRFVMRLLKSNETWFIGLLKMSFTDPRWWSSLREKRVPKRRPWGTIDTNGTLFSKGNSFFLNNHVCEKKTPGSLGHRNSTPKGTILRTAK